MEKSNYQYEIVLRDQSEFEQLVDDLTNSIEDYNTESVKLNKNSILSFDKNLLIRSKKPHLDGGVTLTLLLKILGPSIGTILNEFVIKRLIAKYKVKKNK